jgi:hypothetical protein
MPTDTWAPACVVWPLKERMCLPTSCPPVKQIKHRTCLPTAFPPVALQAAGFIGPPLQHTVSAALGSVEHSALSKHTLNLAH